jgi:hypothetical protein
MSQPLDKMLTTKPLRFSGFLGRLFGHRFLIVPRGVGVCRRCGRRVDEIYGGK